MRTYYNEPKLTLWLEKHPKGGNMQLALPHL